MLESSPGVVDPLEDTINLLLNLGDGYAPGISYDTVWVASHDSLFPKSLEWVLINQREDGSWGGSVEYLHDRVISTLASIVILSRNRRSDRLLKLIEKGEDYLSKKFSDVKQEKHSTIGFELLFPALMAEAERLNLNIPNIGDGYFKRIREEKLSLVLSDLVYTGKTTLSFSAEFLSQDFNVTKARSIKNPNGSVGNSPSATAYLLQNATNQEALEYLEEVYSLNKDGSIMAVYPFEIFEKSWVSYHFIALGLPVEEYLVKHASDIKKGWTKRGAGISQSSHVLDSDDTAVAFRVLTFMGEKLSPEVFDEYEQEENYQCFKYERDPSISSNVHILDAIKNIKGYRNREFAIDKILNFLESKREPDGYWTDKWHLSPYYITSHAIVALHGLDDSLIEKSIDWILETQNHNGSWGIRKGTLEETAYSLWALLFYYENSEKLDERILCDGIRFLSERYHSGIYPELWIAKGLYCPINVVKSAILSVLYKSRCMKLVSREQLVPQAVEQPELVAGGVEPSPG
jgi:halimadienyl-diphosphate synthase